MKGRIYLCGPMSGYPKMNFPEFDRIADLLRSSGYDVISPAQLDKPAVRAAILQGEYDADQDVSPVVWYTAIARDLSFLINCDAVAVLDDWQESEGAKIEVATAMQYNIPVYDYVDFIPQRVPLSRNYLEAQLNASF